MVKAIVLVKSPKKLIAARFNENCRKCGDHIFLRILVERKVKLSYVKKNVDQY